MSKKPLVSVLITSYNREKYIAQAVESVLNSSFQDFELIIVDDASTDKTMDILQTFRNDERVKIYRNKKNNGQFANRNIAANYAQGKYIKYLDSDDIIYPHGLDVMVNIIEQFPDAGAAVSHAQLHENQPYPVVLTPKQAYRSFFLTKGFPNSGPSAAIIRKEAFHAAGQFQTDGYVGNDTVLWLKIAAKYSIVKMPPALIWYRQHENQAIRQGILQNEYLRHEFRVLKKLLESLDCPLNESEKNNAIDKLSWRYGRKILHLALKKKKPRIAWLIYRQSTLPFGHLIRSFFTKK